MIELQVNGDKQTLPEPQPVSVALQQWGYKEGEIAVAINGEFVPRSAYSQHVLQQQDRVEIVAPIQGG